MLQNKFDYTVAHFYDSATVDSSEFNSADLVTINGFHPQGIYHSTSMRWTCHLKGRSSKEVVHSRKEQQSLEKNREYFLKQGYNFTVKKMNTDDYYEFKELYENTTQKKARAIKYRLEDRILGRILVNIPVYCVGMYKNTQLCSGLVFTIDASNTAIVSFGAKQKFQDIRGGVGGTLELELLKFCTENNIPKIDHGKSPNPSGITSKAGLFEFKARYGNTAYPEGEWVTTFIRNPEIALSDLVFVSTINNQVGYIIVSKEEVSEKKYLTDEVTNVQVLSMEEVVAKARSAFT